MTGVQCVYLGIQSDFNNIKSQSVEGCSSDWCLCVYLGIQPDFNNIKSQSVRAAAVTGVSVCIWESSLISITLKVSL